MKDPAAQQKSAPGTTSGAGLAVFDRADALARVDGDDALLATLLALALDDMPLRLEQLEAALQAHDGRAATLQAHNLKGAGVGRGRGRGRIGVARSAPAISRTGDGAARRISGVPPHRRRHSAQPLARPPGRSGLACFCLPPGYRWGKHLAQYGAATMHIVSS